MKSEFKFNKETGTMEPVHSSSNDVIPIQTGEVIKPQFDEERIVNVKAEKVNVQDNQVVKMQRTDKPTAVQLVDENGFPEAYLDSVTTDVLMFRERQDYDIYQIVEERGRVLAYIGGYALQIQFNMSELKTMQRIEQCLEGMKKLFRHVILNQPIH